MGSNSAFGGIKWEGTGVLVLHVGRRDTFYNS